MLVSEQFLTLYPQVFSWWYDIYDHESRAVFFRNSFSYLIQLRSWWYNLAMIIGGIISQQFFTLLSKNVFSQQQFLIPYPRAFVTTTIMMSQSRVIFSRTGFHILPAKCASGHDDHVRERYFFGTFFGNLSKKNTLDTVWKSVPGKISPVTLVATQVLG